MPRTKKTEALKDSEEEVYEGDEKDQESDEEEIISDKSEEDTPTETQPEEEETPPEEEETQPEEEETQPEEEETQPEEEEETTTKKTTRKGRTPKTKTTKNTKNGRGRPKGSKTSKKTKTSDSDDEQEAGNRYFKILVDEIKPENKSPKIKVEDLSSGGGRYTGKNPMQAAKKAFTRICRITAKNGECSYIFSIQETTQSSTKKVFTYRGVRQELETPHEVTKGDTSYLIRFKSEVRSYKPDTPKKNTKTKTQSKTKTPKATPKKRQTKAKK